ncbi:TIGR03364 family FAD-dependent oxidoreductase [Xinfangfangia sp. CPCC 101601]|uniref:TIGR03364 family FAD-dependent oxidoreductase n=1 Tax=Pseudogemmobacter lacusdianii TaxID=3069608 RepID=A0ABU0W163_9RHOB|nr:TIGR03364 family FAD-dependent oxidoreductase [Xinfangfangia sp. CPCC 101601]MDQ2067760.1 TIGR03364 family FAD-dependent oxidoreductase [Xinfangfangia sp. CPCC 101601]
MLKFYDLVVVGAGILGLGTALAGVRAGKSVCVIERDARANGASVRNFGFVTVAGQMAGPHWRRARRSRDVWAEVAPQAGIAILQEGQMLPAYREEAATLLHDYLALPEMGAECRLLTREEALSRIPNLRIDGLRDVLLSAPDLRVESREALPKLAAWLEKSQGVDFRFGTAVLEVTARGVVTSAGEISAGAVVVCPGDDFATLYPEISREAALQKCTLQMLRVAADGMPKLQSAVMSDHSLARYDGFRALPRAESLIARLEREAPAHRAAGVHLIVVQSADGSLVVGDSHVYGPAVEPFATADFDDLIMGLFDEVIDQPNRRIIGHWTGSYASASDRRVLMARPEPHVRVAMITGGTGASTSFAFGEEIIADLFGTSTHLPEDLQ